MIPIHIHPNGANFRGVTSTAFRGQACRAAQYFIPGTVTSKRFEGQKFRQNSGIFPRKRVAPSSGFFMN